MNRICSFLVLFVVLAMLVSLVSCSNDVGPSPIKKPIDSINPILYTDTIFFNGCRLAAGPRIRSVDNVLVGVNFQIANFTGHAYHPEPDPDNFNTVLMIVLVKDTSGDNIYGQSIPNEVKWRQTFNLDSLTPCVVGPGKVYAGSMTFYPSQALNAIVKGRILIQLYLASNDATMPIWLHADFSFDLTDKIINP